MKEMWNYQIMLDVNFCITGMPHGLATRKYVYNMEQSIVTLLFLNKTESIHYIVVFLQ